jgi:hypothetical protein
MTEGAEQMASWGQMDGWGKTWRVSWITFVVSGLATVILIIIGYHYSRTNPDWHVTGQMGAASITVCLLAALVGVASGIGTIVKKKRRQEPKYCETLMDERIGLEYYRISEPGTERPIVSAQDLFSQQRRNLEQHRSQFQIQQFPTDPGLAGHNGLGLGEPRPEEAKGIRGRIRARVRAYEEMNRRHAAEWPAFPSLPGTHLLFHRVGEGAYQIVDSSDRVLASVDDRSVAAQKMRPVPLISPSYDEPLSVKTDGRTYALKQISNLKLWDLYQRRSKDQPVLEMIDTSTDQCVVRLVGQHIDRTPRAQISTANGHSYRLPVTGQDRSWRMLMGAVDTQTAEVLVRFRSVPLTQEENLSQYALNRGISRGTIQVVVEAVIPPQHRPTDQVLLLIVMASASLFNFTHRSTGG